MSADVALGPGGLSTAEAARRLTADGPNSVPQRRPTRTVVRVARQLADPLLVLLLAAAVVTVALGDVPDTAVIVLVIAVNTTVGVIQEVRADRAIQALHQMVATSARVIRGGVHRLVPTSEIVRGDLLVLGQGDIVPADARLVRAEQLRLNESPLTGESVPVSRSVSEEIFAGTTVLAGRGRAEVVRTGAHSALGRITALVVGGQTVATPLQRRLKQLGRQLGLVAVVLSAVVAVVGIAAGQPVVRMAITAVSLVVAAVPESLPAVVTLALALGAMRMARGHAVARQLHAVETLGSVTVVSVDKTGTLTEGRMSVEQAIAADGTTVRPRGPGYEPSGTVEGADRSIVELARAVALCNDARLVAPTHKTPRWSVAGDPIEGALLAFAGRCGVDHDEVRDALPRSAEEPFDASIRRMTTVHGGPDGQTTVVCKGAPETVLDSTVTVMPPAQRERLRATARELAADGLRVLAVAAGAAASPESALPPRDLTPLGLVAIGDPVRDNAVQVAGELDRAGVRLVLITGDHSETAVAIARELGIWHTGDRVVTGDQDLLATVDHTRVFARVRPEQKLDIVTALQARGEVVAMTGDGVNDAPAMRRADIGVAMGAGGTEVARQAADLVLTDDNLATITVAVREGRRIYDNIRRFLRYALAGGVAELAVMLAGPLVGFPLPLLPGQILWVNLLTHGLPGVALGAEPADPGVMRRSPRPPRESVLGDGLAGSVLVFGAVIAVCVLGAAIAGRLQGAPWQSMAFVTLGLAQLGVALAVRAKRRKGEGNPALGAAVALSAFLQIAAVVWSPLRSLLETDPLTLAEFGTCALVALVPGLFVLGWRRAHRL